MLLMLKVLANILIGEYLSLRIQLDDGKVMAAFMKGRGAEELP